MLRGVAGSGGNTVDGITSLIGDVTANGPGAAAATLAPTQPGAHTWQAKQTFGPITNGNAIVLGNSLTGANAQSALDIAATWNTSGTPTAITLNVNDTASNAASLLMDFQVNGSRKFSVRKDGRVSVQDALPVMQGFVSGDAQPRWQIGGAGAINPFVAFGPGGSSVLDVILLRDAANTIAQRNGTNAQAFRIYNTFTDASNYERARFAWVSNVLEIGTEAAGTGTGRNMTLIGSNSISVNTGGAIRWVFNNTGIFANADNTYDIGASGANRPRNIYVAVDVTVGSNVLATGVVRGSNLQMVDGVTAPAVSPGFGKIYIDSADGDLKIIFGDGTVKTIVTDT